MVSGRGVRGRGVGRGCEKEQQEGGSRKRLMEGGVGRGSGKREEGVARGSRKGVLDGDVGRGARRGCGKGLSESGM